MKAANETQLAARTEWLKQQYDEARKEAGLPPHDPKKGALDLNDEKEKFANKWKAMKAPLRERFQQLLAAQPQRQPRPRPQVQPRPIPAPRPVGANIIIPLPTAANIARPPGVRPHSPS